MNSPRTVRAGIALFAATAACAASLPSALADDNGRSIAQSCLYRPTVKSTKVLNNRNILFVMRDGSFYNNQLLKACPGLNRGSALSFTYVNSKVCAGSGFTVLVRTGPSSNPIPVTDPLTNQHYTIQGPALAETFICQIGMFAPINEDEAADLIAATDETRRSRRRNPRDAIQTEEVTLPPDAESAPAP